MTQIFGFGIPMGEGGLSYHGSELSNGSLLSIYLFFYLSFIYLSLKERGRKNVKERWQVGRNRGEVRGEEREKENRREKGRTGEQR